jgi:putative tryptophan/tyrosine transport system substrate-binding protein
LSRYGFLPLEGDMKRREFITALGGAAVWPLAAWAQPTNKVFRIGYVAGHAADKLPKRLEAFRAGLRDLGYEEGRNIVIEYRWADDHYERLPELFAEIVGLKVDVIVTHGTPGVLAAKRVTTTIPIVMASAGDALGSGLVSNLAHPTGNITGLTFFNPELASKQLELIKEVVPNLRDVGVLSNPLNPFNETIDPLMAQTAQTLQVVLHRFAASEPAGFEGVFAEMAVKRVGGLVILDDATLIANSPTIAKLALHGRLPSSAWPDFAIDGGLIAFGVSFPDEFRRAATYVDKILKGAKPADRRSSVQPNSRRFSTSRQPRQSGSKCRHRYCCAPTR